MQRIDKLPHLLLSKLRYFLTGTKLMPKEKTSAMFHNSIENVDALNENEKHWLTSRKLDKRFIDIIYRDVISLCLIDENCTIADFGCGTGVLVNKLKTDFPRIYVVGYDFSASKIKRCQEFYKINPSCFRQGDIYNSTNKKYDVIIATEVLEHLENPAKALKNLFSTLNVEGRLFVTVPNGRTDTYQGHIHFWSPESWTLFVNKEIGHLCDIQIGMLAEKNYALIRKI